MQTTNLSARIRDVMIQLSTKYLQNKLEKLNDVETILLSEVYSGVVSKSVLELIIYATNTTHILDSSLHVAKCIVDNYAYECIYRRKVNLTKVAVNVDEALLNSLIFENDRGQLERFQGVLALFGV